MLLYLILLVAINNTDTLLDRLRFLQKGVYLQFNVFQQESLPWSSQEGSLVCFYLLTKYPHVLVSFKILPKFVELFLVQLLHHQKTLVFSQLPSLVIDCLKLQLPFSNSFNHYWCSWTGLLAKGIKGPKWIRDLWNHLLHLLLSVTLMALALHLSLFYSGLEQLYHFSQLLLLFDTPSNSAFPDPAQLL
jgi:hypothetical protein